LTPFIGSLLNAALPSLGKDLNLDAIGLNWIVISYLLSTANFLLPFGKISDIYGRNNIFFIGAALFSIFSALCVFVKSFTFMIFFRIFKGIGSAMIFSSSSASLVSFFLLKKEEKL